MNWQRRAHTALTTLAVSFILTTQAALAADPEPGPTNPTGFGDLLPAPDLTHGDTRTLFEQYNPTVYGLDAELSWRDPFQGVFSGYAQLMMMYIIVVTRGAIAVGWWLFSFTDVKALTDTASAAIGSVNTELVGWLLPSALAFGAIAAYAQRRASGSAMGQLAWVFVAGLIATSFAMAPKTWLNGVDGARQVGSDAVVATSTEVLGGTMKSPIEMPEPSFSGTRQDTLLRKSGDATWRAFAATPWCVAEFGSLAACQRYGKAILDRGADGDARMDYINGEMSRAEGGNDAPTVEWAKGKNSFGRVGVLTLGAIAASLFAFLAVALAFTALMAFVGCMLLLVVGVLFACLWAIPGRPRQWAMNWFEALLGLVLQSILALLVFSTTLALVTAVFGLTDTLGWLPVSGLAIAVLIAGFRLRRMFESMSTMMRPGMGSLVMGGLARRGAMTAVRRLMGAVGSRAASPTVADRPANRGTTGENAVQRATAVRVFRQAPPLGTSGTALARQRPAHELASPHDRRPLETGTTRPAAGGGRTDAALARLRERSRVAEAHGLAPATGSDRSAGAKRAIAVGLSAGPGRKATGAVAGGSGGGSSEPKRSRHVRETRSSSVGPGRFEPRSRVHTAALRDGPPKRLKEPRRTMHGPMRFREYSSVTKDGVTVMVPTRR